MISTHRIVRSKKTKFAVIALGFFVAFSIASYTNANPPVESGEFPAVALPQAMPAVEAIEILGDQLPQVAAWYGMTPHELRTLATEDKSLWITPTGSLFYVEEVVQTQTSELSLSSGETQALAPLSETFQLHSNPGADLTIYLDFDGHTIPAGNQWTIIYNDGNEIVAPPLDVDGDPTSFSDGELLEIQHAWHMVAEDFAPYNVNVTTEEPDQSLITRIDESDTQYGIRVLISPPLREYGFAGGGVALMDSFDDVGTSGEPAALVYQPVPGSVNSIDTVYGETASHEAGHTVGLGHDGISTQEYYLGHDGWAPIMGSGSFRGFRQWSKGEYTGATNQEDDLAIIATFLPFLSDDHANTLSEATPLIVDNGTNVSGSGLIGTTNDVDRFRFVSGAGTISLNIDPREIHSNLNIQAQLIDSSGTVLATSDPAGLPAALTATVAEGTYYVAIDGVGTGDPDTGYTDYASLGLYSISGSVADTTLNQAPFAKALAMPTTGAEPLDVQFDASKSFDGDGSIVSYAWDFGDGSNSTAVMPLHIYTVSGTYTALLTVTDNEGAQSTDTIIIEVALTPPSAPDGFSASISGDSVILSWTDTSTNEDAFIVERAEVKGNKDPVFEQIAELPANSTEYTDTPGGGTFRYRVATSNAAGISAYTIEITASFSKGGGGNGGGPKK